MILVQRDDQLTQLRNALLSCRKQRRGHLALLTGAVGSGKTSVLDAFTAWSTTVGARVLAATGSRAERHLDLGILRQLLHGARWDAERAAVVDGLLRDATTALPLPAPAGEDTASRALDQAWTPLLHGVFTALTDLADQGPLVLAVDDAHHADPASLQCLLYVARRLRHAQIMILLAEAGTLRPAHPHLRAELLSLPHLSRLALPPLGVAAVEELLDGDTGRAEARRAAECCLAVTGGSPLLTRALVEQQAGGTDHEAGGTGDAFEQAVVGCLYRHETPVRRVAQAMAVLHRPAPAELLGQLLGVAAEAAVRVLRMSGLVDVDGLRHPRIRHAILADLPPEERRALHRRAAEVLHDNGTEASVVAEHLVAAGWADGPWAVPVLKEAAGQALSIDRPDVTAACLRLVGRVATSGDECDRIGAMLVSARWQVNPLTAKGHLSDLVEAARANGWSTPSALSAVPYLLWQGRVEEAVEAVTAGPAEEDGAGGQRATWQLLVSLSAPDELRAVRETPPAWARGGGAPAGIDPSWQAVALLRAALMPATGTDTVAVAEQFVQRHHADDGALGPLTTALLALLWKGRSDRVASWADLLLDRPATRHAPVWRAVLRAVRAEAALRLGDLPGAERHARAALEDLPPAAWGVAVAGPLATLVSCASEAGRPHDAERWLALALPPGTFRTPLGLHYLAARARHHLAVGRPLAATNDLRRCGELMTAWGVDGASLVPWRLELARVQFAVGNRALATKLLQEQLRSPHGIDNRTRGRALRLLAATAANQEQRRKLLSEAVHLLHSSGDRLELVRALGDTGQSLQQAGDSARARLIVRRAYQLAQDCGAPVLAQRLIRREDAVSGVPGGPGSPRPTAAPGIDPVDGLSEAERRVAALAARGHSNRQIARELYITVSTVEQHLTRVYRKLDVKRRTDLPARLLAYAGPPAEREHREAS